MQCYYSKSEQKLERKNSTFLTKQEGELKPRHLSGTTMYEKENTKLKKKYWRTKIAKTKQGSRG